SQRLVVFCWAPLRGFLRVMSPSRAVIKPPAVLVDVYLAALSIRTCGVPDNPGGSPLQSGPSVVARAPDRAPPESSTPDQTSRVRVPQIPERTPLTGRLERP